MSVKIYYVEKIIPFFLLSVMYVDVEVHFLVYICPFFLQYINGALTTESRFLRGRLGRLRRCLIFFLVFSNLVFYHYTYQCMVIMKYANIRTDISGQILGGALTDRSPTTLNWHFILCSVAGRRRRSRSTRRFSRRTM